MGMDDRPPTKEEILFDWFLKDSKEIVSDLKDAVAAAKEVRVSIEQAGSQLAAESERHATELIQAHRELMRSIKDVDATHKRLLADSLRSTKAIASAHHSKLTAWVVAAAFAAGLVGAAVGLTIIQGIGNS